MPEDAEEFISYLVSIDRLDEATVRLAGIINNEKFISKEGKSKHQVQLHSSLFSVVAVSLIMWLLG